MFKPNTTLPLLPYQARALDEVARLGNLIDVHGLLVAPAVVGAILTNLATPTSGLISDEAHRRTNHGARKESREPKPTITLRPFTHPHPHGSIAATLEMMYEAMRDGQQPHGWLFQARWTMVRNGDGQTQYGAIHTNWPDAALEHPAGSSSHSVSVCIGSRDEMTRLFEKGRLHEPTPMRLRRPC